MFREISRKNLPPRQFKDASNVIFFFINIFFTSRVINNARNKQLLFNCRFNCKCI